MYLLNYIHFNREIIKNPSPLLIRGKRAYAFFTLCCTVSALGLLTGCAQGLIPQSRNVDIPPPQKADRRPDAINTAPDSVLYLPLGHDVLMPITNTGDPLPDIQVGPYELRGESLGGALQLILADVDIPIAFQTNLGLSQGVTVTNLKGKLQDVVDQVCSLSDLYCAFEKGTLTVKDRQTFTISIPPIGTTDDRSAMMTSISGAIKAITGREPVIDTSSRTIIYEATSRTSKQAQQYFERMRTNTSLIVYETYVWEVSLNSGNASGISWDSFANAAKWKFGVSLNGTVDPDVGTPISIGLPTNSNLNSLNSADVFKFISSYGAVKTISQPQITMLSGSTSKLRVADKQNYVAKITRTVSGDQVTVATDTASVESGFTLNIESGWDNSTIYGNIGITLQEVRDIVTFDDNPESIVQLPQTTEREVQTQVRVRPGDSLLIAGLVKENDSASTEGPGIDKPILPTARSMRAGNVELVFLLKPRVIVFTDEKSAHERAPVVADSPQKEILIDRKGHEKPASEITLDDNQVNIHDQKPSAISGLFNHDATTDPVVITNVPEPPGDSSPSVTEELTPLIPLSNLDPIPPALEPAAVEPVIRDTLTSDHNNTTPLSIAPQQTTPAVTAPTPIFKPTQKILENPPQNAADVAQKILKSPSSLPPDSKVGDTLQREATIQTNPSSSIKEDRPNVP